jgi:hypothetical protein
MATPFTYEECHRVFSRFLPHASASEMARSCLAEPDESRGLVRAGSDLEFSSIRHVQLTDDTLILLSLDSPELDARVRAYRAAFRIGTPESGAEAADWDRRRSELKQWVEAGYPQRD